MLVSVVLRRAVCSNVFRSCVPFDVNDKMICNLIVIADDETQHVSKYIQVRVHSK